MKFRVENGPATEKDETVPLTWGNVLVGEQVVILSSPGGKYDGKLATVFPYGAMQTVGLMPSDCVDYPPARQHGSGELLFTARRLRPDEEVEQYRYGPAMKTRLKCKDTGRKPASSLGPGEPGIVVGFTDDCPVGIKEGQGLKVGDWVLGGYGGHVVAPTFRDGHLFKRNADPVLVRPLVPGERVVGEGE